MWVNRIAPRLVDFLTAKRVRGLFREEMAARRAQRAKGETSTAGISR
jgi:hypothetical protein